MATSFPPAPGRDVNLFQYREATDATAVAVAEPRPAASYPANWLRLQRSGSVLSSYCGTNGLDWTPIAAVDSSTNIAGAYPSIIRVGLAVTGHNTTGALTEAVMSSYGTTKIRPALTVAHTGGQFELSWPLSSLGWTLQATPSLTTPTVWTNVPGSTTTNLIYAPSGAGNSFFRLAH